DDPLPPAGAARVVGNSLRVEVVPMTLRAVTNWVVLPLCAAGVAWLAWVILFGRADVKRAATWQAMASPGPLLSGHAFLASKCAACHTPNKGVEARNCIACHANDQHLLQRQPTAFHA